MSREKSKVWSFGGIKRTGLEIYQTVFLPTDGRCKWIHQESVPTGQERALLANHLYFLTYLVPFCIQKLKC